MKQKLYGWKRQNPDFRDLEYLVPPEHKSAPLPVKVDLRLNCPPVLDQGNLGSCTANALANAYLFEKMKQKDKLLFLPSRLFVYYNERALEGTVKSDSGAELRDGIKTLNTQGACPETEWPYVISKFKTKPSSKCYTDALKGEIKQYLSVTQDLISLKSSLVSGYPVVFGFTVYSSFESISTTNTGIVQMPGKKESVLGGHAVYTIGYDDSKSWFIVQNSWGSSWGDKGFFYLPYAYLTNKNLASDFWSLRLI
jgi:C1A family cysteine protease